MDLMFYHLVCLTLPREWEEDISYRYLFSFTPLHLGNNRICTYKGSTEHMSDWMGRVTSVLASNELELKFVITFMFCISRVLRRLNTIQGSWKAGQGGV
jgi:hypothetical protein